MSFLNKTLRPIVIATLWISISEFVRNEFFLKSYWTNHYSTLGLVFPSNPINGAMWGVWSLCLAIAIFILSKKFSLLHTAVVSWFMAFVMMWITIGNLGVLPYSLLAFAFPLSLLEVFVASFIVRKLA